MDLLAVVYFDQWVFVQNNFSFNPKKTPTQKNPTNQKEKVMFIDVRESSKKRFVATAVYEFIQLRLIRSGDSVEIDGIIDAFGEIDKKSNLRSCLQMASKKMDVSISTKTTQSGSVIVTRI